MGAGVVLHLLTRPEHIVPGRRRRGVADAVPAAERGQRRIGERGAEPRERIVHTTQMPFIALVQLQDLLAPGFSPLRADQGRHARTTGADDAAHRVAGDTKSSRDPAAAMTLRVQAQDRRAGVLV